MKNKKQDWRGEKGKYFDYGFQSALKKVEKIIDEFIYGDAGCSKKCPSCFKELKIKLKEIEKC